MKFHLKITLSMLVVLSLLFGIGGSLLISASFSDALEREESAAFNNYSVIWTTLQIVYNLEPSADSRVLAQTMEQLYQQNASFWTSLQLSSGLEGIYEGGAFPQVDSYLSEFFEAQQFGECNLRIAEDSGGDWYLILVGAITTTSGSLQLMASHSINDLYLTREALCGSYLQVFLAMVGLCGVLSYLVSHFLTAPLTDLSRATRRIASGDYDSRVLVHSDDDIGVLSQDFNAMAQQLALYAQQKDRYIQELRASMERQDRFVGSFAHEMKTPMTSLIGYADLIRGGTLTPEESSEAAGYLYSEGKRLESLSRKLLELLVLQQQSLPLIPASPAALLTSLGQQLKPVYESVGIRLMYRCEEGLCLLEPDLVWSLIMNLADNARKSMDGGGEVIIRQEMTDEGCRIYVLDNGSGIPPEALEHVTEAFYRVDKARSRRQGGFGLGLSLCHEIVQLHKGSMTFANRKEGGSCVTVELKGGRL